MNCIKEQNPVYHQEKDYKMQKKVILYIREIFIGGLNSQPDYYYYTIRKTTWTT